VDEPTTVLDTRARILAAAIDLFVDQGYQRSSLRQIAARLGLTKTAILYHFPSKAHILAALVEPLTDDLEAAIEGAAARPDPDEARWAVIEGALDVYLTHRRILRLLLQELSLLGQEMAFANLLRIMRQAHEIVAGPGAGLSERIRATQAFAMIGDPVMFFAELPTELLRREVLAGTRLLLSETPADRAPISESAPSRRRAGRPSVMSDDKAAAARRMYAAGTHSVTEIAAALEVSRATVYRHLDIATLSRHVLRRY
jgi:AcrR family transcriptional regulator